MMKIYKIPIKTSFILLTSDFKHEKKIKCDKTINYYLGFVH